MNVVRGEGAMCQQSCPVSAFCPVMLLGRVCPDPVEMVEEFLESQLSAA